MTIDYKNVNPYHVRSPFQDVPNPIKDEAFYILEHYYVNVLHLKQPKLIHLEGFSFHLGDPRIRPIINGDIIMYTQGPMLRPFLYQMFMYALEQGIDSFHIAMIINDNGDKSLRQTMKRGCIESVEAFNRMKHWLRRYIAGKPNVLHHSLYDVLKEGMGLSGMEYIPRQLPELILNTEVHVFEYPGVMIL